MLNFVQIDQIFETWSKRIHKEHGARNINCFLVWIGGKIGYKLTGHTYQESDQKKSTKEMSVDEEKKIMRNILGNRHIA
jgi:hypothetical protein